MAKKPKAPVSVTNYAHDDRRVMNPEVGLVKPDNDPDGSKASWSYDPHIDPALQFDMGRAQIESLIDDALTSGDQEKMRDALEELKRMQAPYLNWAGKAERTSFEIDTVSLHVHERIDPATILEGVKKRMAGGGMAEEQLDFFHPAFEDKPLREALGFYKHDKDWSNRLISGDSLLVMNSLLQKESMRGQFQMIYIDPPYGIKYGSNFQPFTNKRDVKDRADQDLTQEPEMIKAFRDTWELGIHSYLTYIRDRLLLARDLLNERGSVFVQIGEENAHRVRDVLEDVFGSKNFIASITIRKTTSDASEYIGSTCDFVLWFAKERSAVKANTLWMNRSESAESRYSGDYGDGRKFQLGGITSSRAAGEGDLKVFNWFGLDFKSGNATFKTTETGLTRAARSDRLAVTGGNKLRYRRFDNDFGYTPVNNLWADISGAVQSRSDPKVYVVQSSTSIVERCLLLVTDPGDLVLDPTCGSGTAAYAAEKWGRRWITCDTSRVAITLAKQRLMTASFDYYGLRYPHEGLKGGFDYQTVPRITLKSIANNPDIDTIYEEEHPKVLFALSNLNSSLIASPPNAIKAAQGVRKGRKINFKDEDELYEWEVPSNWPEDWPETVKPAFDAFHSARRHMQSRMDQSISDNADQETLFDQPKIDKTKLRVTGKFTVEAVPAPVVMGLEDTEPASEPDDSIARSGATSRQATWRDELLKTGIRGKGGQMLEFADLEVIPGLKNLHASGSLAESGDRVVVSFGPEHAALEQRQVELALQEAEKLRPAPKVIVFCAFTFDPEAAKDIDELDWPGVTLLKAQMNTDLLTEDLKKKRASNQSFWLMGQPDVDLCKRKDGKWEVEVNGFDYFNTKTGELDSGGKSKIAMWSLDTDYNERSLFPHQVFFPMAGAKDGWNRLKATIRAELDEDMLDQFHGTVSLPFEAGENKKVAVKIVDDRGIESLKIIVLDD
ncbi:MAG: site-specific DNA-methyltransferase [Pseudomonadota bacterium]